MKIDNSLNLSLNHLKSDHQDNIKEINQKIKDLYFKFVDNKYKSYLVHYELTDVLL
jgi:hypothetical protein